MWILQTYVNKLVKEGKMPANQAKWYDTVNEAAMIPEQVDSMVEDVKKEFDAK